MTLNDYKSLRSEVLFLAIIKREMNWQDAEKVFFSHPDFKEQITAHDLLEIAVKEALIENNEPITDEKKKEIEEEVKQTIASNLEEWYPVILVKQEDGYIDLSKMKKLETSYKITCQIPLSKYYKECDYSFEEDEDGPYLNIDMEPLEQFSKDYQEGKI